MIVPGNDVVPWLGDFRYFGTSNDALPGESAQFPVKPEKRSYSQNCVVWIKQAGLQSDIQKVLRHAKKLPEKTQQFYKVCILFRFGNKEKKQTKILFIGIKSHTSSCSFAWIR